VTRAAVVIPVKVLRRAKTRLRLPEAERRQVMTTLLTTTLRAALDARGVSRVIVVTADPYVASLVRSIGATHVGEGTSRGLNAALERGREFARASASCSAISLLVGDLANLVSADLTEVLDRYEVSRTPLMVEDWVGTGTTCLVHGQSSWPAAAFGPGSAARHRALGYLPVGGGLASLRRDVDTLDDLHAIGANGASRVAASRPPTSRSTPRICS